MTPVSYFVLHLITLPDINYGFYSVNRLVFSYQQDCIEIAQELRQLYDPWVRKPNCVEVKDYEIRVRVPLKKPVGMP